MPSGRRYTTDDTVTPKRSITDIFKIITPSDVPLIARLGLDGSSKLRLVNWPSTKLEWLEDTLAPASVVLSTTMDNSQTNVVVTANATKFHVGDMVKLESEYMYVTAIVDGDNITVVRARWGSSAAAHTADAVLALSIITNARLEGAESSVSYSTVATAPFNYTQIFHKEIDVTRTEAKRLKYGINDLYDLQIQKAIGGGGAVPGQKGRAGELPIKLENAAFHGKAFLGTGTLGQTMGGLPNYITTNVTTIGSTTALDRKSLEDTIQNCWTAGGAPNLLVCNAWGKRKITSFYEGGVRLTYETTMGGLVIDRIDTEFGQMDILLDRHCPSNEVWILDESRVGFLTFDEFFVEDLAKGGDYMKGEVIGEYSFFVCNQTAHGVVRGFSTSK